MRPLLIMAAVAAVATLVGGCRDKKPEPVPGPQSALTQRTTAAEAARHNTALRDCPGSHQGVSEISWFQGTLEEGFSHRSSKGRSFNQSRPLFRY